MNSQEKNCWLKELEKRFSSLQSASNDLHYLLSAMLKERKMNFPQFIYEISRGYGCTVYEGLSYSLENDWDDPTAFDGVTFFFGGQESSVVPISDYIALITIAADVYINFFPDEKKSILEDLRAIQERYLHEKT